MRPLKNSLQAMPLALIAAVAIGVIGAPAVAAEAIIPGFGAPLDGGSVVLRDHPARATLAAGLVCGIQLHSTIPAKSTQLWYVRNVPHSYTLGWYVMADTTSTGPSVSLLTTATQQTDSAHATYWLGVANYATTAQTFEMRYCVL